MEIMKIMNVMEIGGIRMKDSFAGQMKRELGALGIALDERQLEQFYRYYKRLIETNKVMNLTAITEEHEVVTKHFVDSLSLVYVISGWNEGKAYSVIDVGTGAGFPGIPLKIAFPEVKVTLLDSLNKRVNFLREVCVELGLSGVEAVHGRAEDFGRAEEYREKFDYGVSRAVANLAVLCEYCLPFVRVGGRFIAYKSGEVEEEIKGAEHAIDVLGGKVEKVFSFELPGTEMKRSFVVIRKERRTAKKYPRKAGVPGKEPL